MDRVLVRSVCVLVRDALRADALTVLYDERRPWPTWPVVRAITLSHRCVLQFRRIFIVNSSY